MKKPLIKPSTNIWGANALPMKHDDHTPPCRLCAHRHVGVLTPVYLMLRGNFVMVDDLGTEIFVPASHNDIEFIELPSGRKALLVDTATQHTQVMVVHEDCAHHAKEKLEELVAFEGNED